MSAAIGTYEIGLDTPIHMLTPRQLFEMQREWTAAASKEGRGERAAERPKRYAYSMDELAAALNTSRSTAYRMKSEGLLDEAISQYGKWMCIDVDKVIEIFKLSNRRKKRR